MSEIQQWKLTFESALLFVHFLLAITALQRKKRSIASQKIIHITTLQNNWPGTTAEWHRAREELHSVNKLFWQNTENSHLLFRFPCLHKHIPVILPKVSGQSAQPYIAVDKMPSAWSLSTGEKRQHTGMKVRTVPNSALPSKPQCFM